MTLEEMKEQLAEMTADALRDQAWSEAEYLLDNLDGAENLTDEEVHEIVTHAIDHWIEFV